MDDHELLREYVEHQSERAFAELVARHVDLVYGAAWRVVGEGQAAQDVAQAVFIRLARKGWMVRVGNALPGWLYRAACREAFNFIRGEQRRRQREGAAMSLAEPGREEPVEWEQVAPLLEEAMGELRAAEQNAVVLRFFKGKSFRETGEALAISEEAARKSVSRALEKMRNSFARRGVATSAVLLGTAISSHAAVAAPTGLAANITGASLAGLGGGNIFLWSLKALYMNTKTKALLATAAMAAMVAIPLAWQYETNAELRKEVATVRKQIGPENRSPGVAARAGGVRTSLTDAELDAHIQAAVKNRITGDHEINNWADDTRSPWFVDWVNFLLPLSPGELARVAAKVDKLPYESLRDGLRKSLFDRWAEIDFPGALAKATAIPQGDFAPFTMQHFVGNWAKRDATAAAAWLEGQPEGSYREWMIKPVVAELVRANPQAALDLIGKLSNPLSDPDSEVTDAYVSLTRSWPEADYFHLATQIMALPEGKVRRDVIKELGTNWKDKDFARSVAWAQTLPDFSGKNGLVGDILVAWSRVDLAAALAGVEQLPDIKERQRIMGAAVSSWANRDGPAAATYVAELPPGPERQKIMADTISSWANKDAPAAVAYVTGLPAGPERQKFMENTIFSWANQDAPAAAAYVAGLPEGAERQQLEQKLKEYSAEIKLVEAVDEVPTEIPHDEKSRQALMRRVEYSKNHAELAAWAANVPEDLQPALYGKIMEHWSPYDAVAAVHWVLNLPKGEPRDTAVYTFIYEQMEFLPTLPAEVAPLAETMEPGPNRTKSLEIVASKWLEYDPVAAEKWMTTVSLTEAQKQKLLRRR